MENRPSAQESESEAWLVNALFDYVSFNDTLSEGDLVAFLNHNDPKNLIKTLAESGLEIPKGGEVIERYIKLAYVADRHTSKDDYKGRPPLAVDRDSGVYVVSNDRRFKRGR